MNDSMEATLGIICALRIAREGSFRGAMRSTGLGFRTLQKHVQKLEQQLGVPIFHRTTEGIVPTNEGQHILQEAEKIEAILTKIFRLGKSLSNEAEGDVSLATTEGLGTFWISPRLSGFNKLNPKISVRLHPSMAIADMRRFETDIALQVVEPLLPEVKRVKVARLHLMLAAAPSYIAKHGEPKTVEDLKNHLFVLHTSPQSSDRQLIENAVGSKLAQAQYIVMRNSTAHYLTIEKGHGIGFLPSYPFGVGTNVVPLDVPLRYELDVWLCFHEGARNTPRIAKVIDWLISIFDPRLYPWFRRDFVQPSKFDGIIDSNGSREHIAATSMFR